MSEQTEKKKRGRPKLEGKGYMERTQPYVVRINKELVEDFNNAFHQHKLEMKRNGKKLFLNSIITKLIKSYLTDRENAMLLDKKEKLEGLKEEVARLEAELEQPQ